MALSSNELQYNHRRTKKGTISNKRAYCKKSAIQRGLDFDLSTEYLTELWDNQDGKCALSGVDLGYIGCGWCTASVDRIDPTKGYIEGNVQWTAWRVNDAKSNMRNDDFINMCRAIAITNK